MEEDPVQEPESVETTSNEFNLLLDEITARCNKQTKEIDKWLLYTKDFKQTITNTLEQEKLKKQRADIKAMKWTPGTPRTPRTVRAVRSLRIHY
ncbi:hypothetical protein N7491_007767 [Penicillium cf. griseofulvum]|uniref:Uncharacterized protein n=1 Tax=Penicillium cf. griseofulvum TaxID=2972120 RepID=A0A9W9IWZ8_9EURO|nr:hypothetical protein N7472_009205 [Penicillium cf. griseofulvum]KAJ5430751.1 hypothetical protein N7491_007767 [Penicillium cf. griseofulvum]KAJ5435479.1 hypothetical protein N7445_006364 [Penicillium cf. griseofulvum]